jgi:hypothetical protein
MSETFWIALIATIPGLAGVIIGIYTLRTQARKDTMILLQQENKRLWDRNSEMQDEIDELRELIAALQSQVRNLGHVPVRAPKKSDTRPREDNR